MKKTEAAILKAARDAARYAKTGVTNGSVRPVEAPEPIDVARLRKRWRMTQEQFAEFIRVNVATVRDWEQQRRKPSAAALTLITVLMKEPLAAARALGYGRKFRFRTSKGPASKTSARGAKNETAGAGQK